jgi:hypothetical protein
MTELDLPRFTSLDLWLARSSGIRNVADLVVRQRLTDAEGHARVARLARFNLTLTAEDINAAWEQLVEAEKRLAHIRSDMWDPAEGWRDDLELAADWDAINAVKKLAGKRP